MLSHLRISAAKPAAKPFNLSDGQGLFLTVQPNGSKLWKLSFRHLGKQKTLHLGLWPDVGLADARERRDEARRQIAAGLDPALEKKRARVAAKVAAANTFKDVAEEWVQKCEREGRAEITLSKIRWLLGMAYPMIGSLPIANITPQEVLAVLRKVESDGRYESARRMRSVLSRVFRYGVATVRCQKDVAAEAGLLNRRRVLGDAWVDRSLANRTDFSSDFQAMITRIAWQEIWGRPGLDDRTRRLLVLAITASLGRWEEFALHVRTGLVQGGFTKDELKEVLMQTAIYAGVPAANTGFAEAQKIIADIDLEAA